MEQQVAALIQQVVEMSDRMRQRGEAAEPARQLLEAHWNAGQMLEERMNQADAIATAETSLPGGIRPGRDKKPEAPGADGRFGFGVNGEDTGVPDSFNVDEYKK